MAVPPGRKGIYEKVSLVLLKTQILTSSCLGLGPWSCHLRIVVRRELGLLRPPTRAPLFSCPFWAPPLTPLPCPGSPLGLDTLVNIFDFFTQSRSQHLGTTVASPQGACVLGNQWENWNHEIGRGL